MRFAVVFFAVLLALATAPGAIAGTEIEVNVVKSAPIVAVSTGCEGGVCRVGPIRSVARSVTISSDCAQFSKTRSVVRKTVFRRPVRGLFSGVRASFRNLTRRQVCR